jgi:hypothetical protein
MSYLYTQVNRLEEPHKYMYTAFQGQSLLQAFHTSRADTLKQLIAMNFDSVIDDKTHYEGRCILSIVSSFEHNSETLLDSFSDNVQRISASEQKNSPDAEFEARADSLEQLSVQATVSTLELLKTLIAAQLVNRYSELTKLWLDRLVQRFEVTKKLYETYPAGFRKGEGSTHIVKLYWLFSLLLSLYLKDKLEFKYLSTLLKVNDLLCSLPDELHAKSISSEIMTVILINEMLNIKQLTQQKGIPCS